MTIPEILVIILGGFGIISYLLKWLITPNTRQDQDIILIKQSIENIDTQLSNHITELKESVKSIDEKTDKHGNRLTAIETILNERFK